MTAAVQLGLVVAIIVVAFAYLARRAWRHVTLARQKRGCGPGCGCG